MDGHQRHLVVGIFVRGDIHVAQQGDVLQKVVQGIEAGLAPFRHIVFLLLAPLLHVLGHAVDQFLQVGHAGLSLDRGVQLVGGVQAAVIGDLLRQLPGIRDRHQGGQLLDHLAERPHLRYLARRLEKRPALLPGHGFHRLHRLVADPARRFVDHPPERLVIARVDDQLEIGHHILDLGAVEEGIAGINHIGDVAPAELLLQRTRLRIGPI